jgi:hypothetical protein
MHSFIQRLGTAFSIIALTAALVSCGGGGGGSDSVVGTADGLTTADKGTVTLLVTDAPTDDFKEINMTILKAELLCDSGNQELFSGVKEFDLLQLTDVTEIFSVSEVTAGFCSKIRLKLAQIELVFKDSSKPSVLAKLLGDGKLDLKSKADFFVGPYDPLYIQLDFDAKKSIHIKSKAKYNFRPVVFIKIIKGKFDTKLVRQRGTVKNLDGDSEEFDLCLIEAEVQPVSRHEDDDSSDDDASDCVRVNTTDAPASIFDNHADPISFKELEENDIATVVGRFSFYDSKSSDKSSDDKSSDDSSSDDGSSDDNDRPGLVLAAEVIWTGIEIAQTTNIACSGVTTDEVTTDDENDTWYKNYELPIPEDGEVCVIPGATRTVLQPGAKIYDSEGNELDDYSSIAKGILNKVDAYAGTVSKPIDPKAVLVMLGLNEPLNPLDQLTGTINFVDIDFGNELSNLILTTVEGERCVNLDNVETEVFETKLDDGHINFEQMSVFSLEKGQRADVFGTENGDCLDAEIIIYEQEAEIDPV